MRIINFYVRDRQLGEVLRRSLLTKSQTDLKNGTWDSVKWINTLAFLKSSFGVDAVMIREQITFLEMFS